MRDTSSLVIGIDAGATKTAAVLGALDGGVLSRLRTEPSAIVGLPDSRSLAVLRGVVDKLAPERGALAHFAIGLSGVDFPDECQEGAYCDIVDDLWVKIYALRELQYSKMMKRVKIVPRPFLKLDRRGANPPGEK